MEETLIKLKNIMIKVNVDGMIKDALKGVEEANGNDLYWNVNDTLKINVENETIEYIRNKFAGNQIKILCHFEEIIKENFEEIDARKLFTEFPNIPDDIVIDEDVKSSYEIVVEAENMPRKVITGQYCMEELPIDYPKIIRKVVKIIDDIELWGEIFNPAIYARPSKRKSDIIYCGIEFGEYSSIYHYITDDDSIEVGDTVIVPVGKNNREVEGYVAEKKYCPKEDVPYPLSKVKKIIRKIESVETFDDAEQKISKFVGKRIKAIRDDYTSVIGVLNNFKYDKEFEEFYFYVQTENENVLIESEELMRIELKEM